MGPSVFVRPHIAGVYERLTICLKLEKETVERVNMSRYYAVDVAQEGSSR